MTDKKNRLFGPLALGLLLSIPDPSISATGQRDSPPPAKVRAEFLQQAEAQYEQARVAVKKAQPRPSIQSLFEAVRLWEHAGYQQRAIEALFEMAEIHMRADRWQYALQCYKRLLDFNVLTASRKSASLNSVALLYARFRQQELGEKYYRQGLDAANRLTDRPAQAAALLELAAVAAELADPKTALAHLDRAQKLAGSGLEPTDVADAFRAIGEAYEALGSHNDALRLFEQALVHFRKTDKDPDGEARVLSRISGILLASNKERAFDYANDALKLAADLKITDGKWRAWVAAAKAQRALGRPQQAISSYFRAISLIELRYAEVSADVLRLAFLDERLGPYHELAGLLIEAGRIDEAFVVAERARARATLVLLSQRPSANSPTLRPYQTRKDDLVREIARLNTELRSGQNDENRRALILDQLKAAEQRLEELRVDEEMTGSRRTTRVIALETVKSTVLGPDETLIEFLIGEDCSYLWIVSQKQSDCIALPSRKEIDGAVKHHLALLSSKPNAIYLDRETRRIKKSAADLFTLLLGQVAALIPQGNRLIVAPDGLLHYLPFEALLRNGRYLIEQHEISYVPSAGVLAALKNARSRNQENRSLDLVAFGDPIFARESPGDLASIFWFRNRYRLARLPGTRSETASIAGSFAPERSRVQIGADATEERLKQSQLRSCRILHFATHSLIDERFPARSAVVLALDDDPGEDGFLEVREIAELDLDCDLVVLSACQTGGGPLARGEGIAAMSRAFLHAGARAVAVSLWNVSDISTADFMKRFYKQLAANLPARSALRETKLQMINSTSAVSHPYYWAPFVVVGNT